MATATSINIQMPRGDMSFLRQLAKRMGWTVSMAIPTDSLYDPETGEYLNEETMKAIRDVEAGHVKKCKNLDELLAEI